MLVQINQQHISPFAQPVKAQALVHHLQAEGWPDVEYTDGPAVWEFDSEKQMFEFEKAFEAVRESITGPAYQWQVKYPCTCWRDSRNPIPCHCGDSVIHESNPFDFGTVKSTRTGD